MSPPSKKTVMLLAAGASVDQRTAARFLAGTPIRGQLALERLEAAAKELGLIPANDSPPIGALALSSKGAVRA